jgi:hypothetical protein
MKEVKEVVEGKKYEDKPEVAEAKRKVQASYYLWYIYDLKAEHLKNKKLKDNYGYAMNLMYYKALKHTYPRIINAFETKYKEEITHKVNDWLTENKLQSCNYYHKEDYRMEQMFLLLLQKNNGEKFFENLEK